MTNKKKKANIPIRAFFRRVTKTTINNKPSTSAVLKLFAGLLHYSDVLSFVGLMCAALQPPHSLSLSFFLLQLIRDENSKYVSIRKQKINWTFKICLPVQRFHTAAAAETATATSNSVRDFYEQHRPIFDLRYGCCLKRIGNFKVMSLESNYIWYIFFNS